MPTKSRPVISEAADGHHPERRAGRPARRGSTSRRCRGSRARSRDRRRLSHPGPPPCGSRARSTSRQHAEQHDGPDRLEAERRRAAPSPSRWPSQMSAGTWRYAAHGSAMRQLPSQPGKSTSGTRQPAEEDRAARTRASRPGRVEQPERRAGDEEPDRRSCTTTASAHARPRTRARPAASAGSAMSKSSAPTKVGATPAGEQVVRRAAEVAGEVPAEQPHRPVEVDRDVAGPDPLGEVVGGAAAPQRDRHQHRLAEPDVGDRVGRRRTRRRRVAASHSAR